jgi:hypothetical protein
MAICPLCQAMSSDSARACESCGAPMEPVAPLKPLGRTRALVAFIGVSFSYVLGMFGFVYGMVHSNTHEELRTSSRLLQGTGTFTMLCNLMAIILGATAIPRREGRWARARAFGIAAVTMGAVGIIGSAFLLLLASLFKDCANCNGCNGCGNSLSGIGTAVPQ